MVFTEQQREDINIVLTGFRPVDQKPRGRALPERVIDIFWIVGKHTKGTIPANNRIGAGKAFHQDGCDFKLSRARLAIAALTGELIDIVNRPKADHIGINDIVYERFGILSGFPLIAINAIR